MKTTALGDFLGDLDTMALYHADTVPTADCEKRRDNLADAEARIEAETLCDKPVDGEAKTLVDMLADTL